MHALTLPIGVFQCVLDNFTRKQQIQSKILPVVYCEKKEEIWLSPMTKAPTPTEMSKRHSDNTNNATKKFD